jgi:hypothetical protein
MNIYFIYLFWSFIHILVIILVLYCYFTVNKSVVSSCILEWNVEINCTQHFKVLLLNTVERICRV